MTTLIFFLLTIASLIVFSLTRYNSFRKVTLARHHINRLAVIIATACAVVTALRILLSL
ncbi:MAG: hypothetical protein HUK08_00265 [Bacteroidaceae bacterium]|nr:hypothetical protein [Bacteroidaceae bacterium]